MVVAGVNVQSVWTAEQLSHKRQDWEVVEGRVETSGKRSVDESEHNDKRWGGGWGWGWECCPSFSGQIHVHYHRGKEGGFFLSPSPFLFSVLPQSLPSPPHPPPPLPLPLQFGQTQVKLNQWLCLAKVGRLHKQSLEPNRKYNKIISKCSTTLLSSWCNLFSVVQVLKLWDIDNRVILGFNRYWKQFINHPTPHCNIMRCPHPPPPPGFILWRI